MYYKYRRDNPATKQIRNKSILTEQRMLKNIKKKKDEQHGLHFLDFGIVPTVWYILFLISSVLYNGVL